MRHRRAILVLLALLCIGSWARAEDYPVGPWGRFHLDIPKGWTADVTKKGGASGPAIRVVPDSGAPLVLFVSPVPLPSTAPPRAARRAKLVAVVLDDVRSIAVETDLTEKELFAKHCAGFYFSLTDKTVTTPTLADFKYEMQGAAQCDGADVVFTILTNLASGPERGEALNIARSVRYESTNASVQTR